MAPWARPTELLDTVLGTFSPVTSYHAASILFFLIYFIDYAITVVPFFSSPLSSSDLTTYTPPPLSFPQLNSCPWVIHKSSLASPFPILFLPSPSIFFNFIYLLLERGDGEEKERETSICGCLSQAPYWGPGLQLMHVPWLGIKPATLWFTGCAQSPGPHQPGPLVYCVHPIYAF